MAATLPVFRLLSPPKNAGDTHLKHGEARLGHRAAISRLRSSRWNDSGHPLAPLVRDADGAGAPSPPEN
jgi:hypothetical protein